MNKLDKMLFSLSVLIFVKLITLKIVFADGPPRKLASEGHRQIIFAPVNESITLKCPIEASEFSVFVEWTKGNSSLYMIPGYDITPRGDLKIKSLSYQHAGIYTCEAINGYGAIRVNLTLVVDNPELQNKNYTFPNRNSANRVHSFPPVITKRPSAMYVDVGEEATFHCITSGQPVPRIFWIKDGHLIEGSNSYTSKRKTHSILKLKALKKSDEGTYKCIAHNSLGEDEMDFSLYVTEQSPPPKIIALDPPNVTIREGATIAFVCEVASRPGVQLHIKWLKRQDGIEESLQSKNINLFRSGKLYYRPLNLTDTEFVINGGVYKSKILIKNSCEADSGTYVCLALNDKGFNFRNSTLKVISRPKPVANPTQFPTSSTPLAVTIIVGFVVTLAVVVFISHLCCRSKSEEKITPERKVTPNIETGSARPFIAPVRKTQGDFNPYPEIVDPQLTSKLLAIDSAFLYEHSESQISKSAQTRTNFH